VPAESFRIALRVASGPLPSVPTTAKIVADGAKDSKVFCNTLYFPRTEPKDKTVTATSWRKGDVGVEVGSGAEGVTVRDSTFTGSKAVVLFCSSLSQETINSTHITASIAGLGNSPIFLMSMNMVDITVLSKNLFKTLLGLGQLGCCCIDKRLYFQQVFRTLDILNLD